MKKVKASNISRFTKRLLPVDALAEVAQVCAEFSNINSYKSRQKQCKESAQQNVISPPQILLFAMIKKTEIRRLAGT